MCSAHHWEFLLPPSLDAFWRIQDLPSLLLYPRVLFIYNMRKRWCFRVNSGLWYLYMLIHPPSSLILFNFASSRCQSSSKMYLIRHMKWHWLLPPERGLPSAPITYFFIISLAFFNAFMIIVTNCFIISLTWNMWKHINFQTWQQLL